MERRGHKENVTKILILYLCRNTRSLYILVQKIMECMGRWSLTAERFKSNFVGTHTFCRKNVVPSLWKVCVRVYWPSFNPFYWGKYFSRGKRYMLFKRASMISCIMQIYSSTREEWYSKGRQILTCMKMNMMSTKYLSTVEHVSRF